MHLSDNFTPEEFEKFLISVQDNIDLFSREELEEIDKSIRHIQMLDQIEKARTDFLTFVKVCGAPFLKFSSRGQHDKLAAVFEAIVDGDLKRVTVSLPPRFGKSEFGSILLPAWFIGKNPTKKVMQLSSTEDLATDFGRKVKAIIDSPSFQKVFPGVRLAKDSKANGKFATNQGGEYFALGITSKMAGKGADLLIADDLTSEQEAKSGDPAIYETAWSLFISGPLHRLQAGGRIIVIQTRWSKADIIGKLKRNAAEDPNVDQYLSIEFPALDENGESTFPEVWPTEDLVRKRNTIMKVAPHFWFGPYQQDPTSSENSKVPASLWKKWDKFERIPGTVDEVQFVPPDCSYILMVLDTAETMNKRSNPTACTIWGLFEHTKPNGATENYVILLHSYCEKLEFHLLKQKAKEWIKDWHPHSILVEAKSTGPALRSELREANVFTEPVRPKPGEDKAVRLASVSDVFHSGMVYYIPTAANQRTISQVADFPNGEGDDLVDTVSYALRKFRSGGLVKTVNDEQAKEDSGMPIDYSHY